MSVRGVILLLYVSLAAPAVAAGQEHQHPAPSPAPVQVPEAREGSGTSWLPDASPMFAVHGPTLRGWRTMFHGVGFLQYFRDEPPRGESQAGSVNWIMGHARKAGAFGELSVRGMISLEPLTIRGCGYPDLLASGEVCDGHAIVDRQHPHDLVMEISGLYSRRLTDRVALQLYGGPAGEPALGPVAFPHRLSAFLNPIAPISHHWLDATHLTYGVFTVGVHGQRWKVEASTFNGREPDDDRYDFDFGAMDSYSARVSFLPTPRLALQMSAGHLEEAEQHGAERADVDRVTASAIHHTPLAGGGVFATTVAWGRNQERGESTQALVAEASASLADRDLVFGRAEIVQKSGHDLDLHTTADEMYQVGKIQLGYSRFLAPRRGWRVGIGGSVSAGIVSNRLAPTYGGRVPLGVAAFLTLRPAAMTMNEAARP